MRITLLGTGTSHGIPVIGCQCAVCTSSNPRNNRTRCSILVEEDGTAILIDTSADFRTQALRERIDHIDAVFYTHPHADHLHGIDDLRQLSRERPIPVYASRDTSVEIERRFPYLFQRLAEFDSRPRISMHVIDGACVRIDPLEVYPVALHHGRLPILGFRIGSFAYLTDCSAIPDASFDLLRGVSLVVIDALRFKSHPTHFSVPEALNAGRQIGANQVVLTHICHEVEHSRLERELPPWASPGYDGMKIEIE